MKIASWNVNSLNVRLPHLLEWLRQEPVDILGLQETKLVDEKFPREAIEEAGYHVLFSGQKTYNGVALLSREPALEPVTDLPGLDDPQRRVLGATVGEVRFLNLYVPNGQEVGAEKYAYKLEWLERLQAYVEEQVQTYEQLVVVGDFNIAPDDRDVHDPKAWAGRILCSDPEREAFRRLLGAGLSDSFRLFEQEERSFSWWDYRMNGFKRNLGLRIDHILVSEALRERCTASRIDKVPRGWERPSDHAPAVAEFA
ncbi:exodeoxyribonuclease III [Endothiovibrio diazotrophicus]